MGEEHRITLGDYRRLDNLDEVSLGFQPANPVVFDIKNSVTMNLKSNQFSSKEMKDYNAHLTHFMDACIITNPAGVLESDKRLKLFGYSLPKGQGIGLMHYQAIQSRLGISSRGSYWTGISQLQHTWHERRRFPASSNKREKSFMIHGRGSNYC